MSQEKCLLVDKSDIGYPFALGSLLDGSCTRMLIRERDKPRQIFCVGFLDFENSNPALEALRKQKRPVLVNVGGEYGDFFRSDWSVFFTKMNGTLVIQRANDNNPVVLTSVSNLHYFDIPFVGEVVNFANQHYPSVLNPNLSYRMNVEGVLQPLRSPSNLFGVVSRSEASTIDGIHFVEGEQDGFLVFDGLKKKKIVAAMFCPDLVSVTYKGEFDGRSLAKKECSVVDRAVDIKEAFKEVNIGYLTQGGGVIYRMLPELGEYYVVTGLENLPRYGIDSQKLTFADAFVCGSSASISKKRYRLTSDHYLQPIELAMSS